MEEQYGKIMVGNAKKNNQPLHRDATRYVPFWVEKSDLLGSQSTKS
jgi:hypothetical protein